jgi:hypothetical protein
MRATGVDVKLGELGSAREELPSSHIGGQARAERLRKLFAGLASQLGHDPLVDPYLIGFDLSALAKAVRASGLNAKDLRLALAGDDFAIVEPLGRHVALLAMAFADGFGSADATYLRSQVTGSTERLQLDQKSEHDVKCLFAAVHALRLRGCLGSLAGGEWHSAWEQHNVESTQLIGRSADLLDLLLTESEPGDADALAVAARVAVSGGMRGASRLAANRLRLEADEKSYIEAVEQRLRSGGEGGLVAWELAMLHEERHAALLQSVISSAQLDRTRQSAADAASLGLLAAGGANAEAAFRWFEQPGQRNFISLEPMARALPVDALVRCTATLGDGDRGGAMGKSLRTALVKWSAERLEVLRLSPRQRQSALTASRSLLSKPDLSREARAYCLDVLGRIGTIADIATIEQVALRYGLESEVAAAAQAIRRRG